MNYTRKVKCIQTYVEDNEEFWTEGQIYDAVKHRDGNWSIETNLGTNGMVGPSYLLDDFSQNFIDVSKKENKESVLEEMKDLLEDSLPHGSGVNYKWHFKRHKDNFEVDNAYDHMNDVGMYDRCISFSVKIPDKDPMKFKVIFHGSSADQKFAQRDDLRPYLEDLIAESISPVCEEYKNLANSLSKSKAQQGR